MSNDHSDATVTHIKGARKDAQAALMSFVESGHPKSIKIMQSADETMIGREKSCHIYIADSRVSRKHALIQVEHSEVKLADLGSLNGISRNGEQVRGTIILNDGDHLIVAGAHSAHVRIREEDETIKSVFIDFGKDQYLIAPGDVFIGSDPNQSDIVINDPSIGARHAHLDFLFDGAYLSCIDKSRGLKVDNQPTECQKLESKSLIKMGAVPINWTYLPDEDQTGTGTGTAR